MKIYLSFIMVLFITCSKVGVYHNDREQLIGKWEGYKSADKEGEKGNPQKITTRAQFLEDGRIIFEGIEKNELFDSLSSIHYYMLNGYIYQINKNLIFQNKRITDTAQIQYWFYGENKLVAFYIPAFSIGNDSFINYKRIL